MSGRHLLHVVGAVVAITGISMLSAVAVAAIYQEWNDVMWLLVASGITILIGGLSWRISAQPGELTTREAFAAVGLAWFAIAAFGALPFLLTGSISSLTDAFFESASGFTATGSSVIADPATLSHGVLFWRALTQWLGGMGVIILAISLLPLIGVGAHHLATAESPGPIPERLTPRFRDTANRLWTIYVGLTVAQVVLLTVGDMNLFEAVTHAFTTLSGGGFSTSSLSLGGFSAYSQWIVVVFMLAGGTSFALHYHGLRKPMRYIRNAEFRLYMIVVLLATSVVIAGTWSNALHDTVRDAVFTVSSILTTTGYATADFDQWAPPLGMLIIGMMFIGAMAGSTSGSVKVYRIKVLFQTERAYIRRVLHPRRVFLIREGRRTVPAGVVESVRVFFFLYMFTFMTGTALLALLAGFGSTQLDVVSIASAVAASLGNVGPGLGAVGPTHTFAVVPAAGKWLLSIIMIIGRLEILPIVLLLTPEAWHR